MVVYNFLIQENALEILRPKFVKYQKEVNSEMEIQEYAENFKCNFRNVKDIRSGDFQYRQLIFTLFTNDILFKWKVVNTDTCEFCTETQTIKHLFWECKIAKEMYGFISDIMEGEVDITYENIFTCKIANITCHVANHLCLLAKKYIDVSVCKRGQQSLV